MAGNPDQLIQSICDTTAAMAPPGWRRIVLKVWATVVAFQVEVTVVMADGSSPSVEPPAVSGLVADLRTQMYLPDRGTWFSARFELRAGEPPRATFNLDEDPAWWPAVPPQVFAHDLAAFPRADEHVPGWLRKTLDDAAALAPQAPD